ncbi:MAG: MaoC family dehydratase [Winogradskyella sp.]|nr:MAG: MaoC family dehydratase [Winogradskyella sp.]
MKTINIGDAAEFSKTITEHDILTFAGVTGDFNEVHINKVKAEKSIFKERIAHGMLTASFISTVIGMYLPGKGSIYLEQNLKFLKPVKIGDTITAKVVVEKIDSDKNIYKLITTVTNTNDDLVVDGNAKILYK